MIELDGKLIMIELDGKLIMIELDGKLIMIELDGEWDRYYICTETEREIKRERVCLKKREGERIKIKKVRQPNIVTLNDQRERGRWHKL